MASIYGSLRQRPALRSASARLPGPFGAAVGRHALRPELARRVRSKVDHDAVRVDAALPHRRAERSLVALPPSPDLFVHARELLVEANRLEATKAGITVGQEQRPSIYAVLFAGPISPVWNGSRLSARQDHPHRAGQPLGERLHREAAPRCQRGLLARSASRALSASGRTDGPFDLILTNEPEDLRLKLVAPTQS